MVFLFWLAFSTTPAHANVLHLTWATQRFGEAVVERWQVNTTKLEVIMAVNRGWDDLGYLERYRLVNHLGTTLARDDYRLRIIDPQGATRATYACGASPDLNNAELGGLEADSRDSGSLFACELVLQDSITVPLKASLKSGRRD